MHGDSTARMNAVLKNPNLTPAQKNAKIADIEKQDDSSPLASVWVPSAAIIGVCIVVLLAVILTRAPTEVIEAPTVIAPPEPVEIDSGSSPPLRPWERSAAVVAPAAPPPPDELEKSATEFDEIVVAEPTAPVIDTLPQTQADVDAIPLALRGISFFTSRPLSLADLVEVKVVVGGTEHSVHAAAKEAEKIAEGRTPSVRAFDVNGEITPWYKCAGYDPYANFCEVVAQGWVMLGTQSATTWITVEELDGAIDGYLSRREELAARAAQEVSEPTDVAPVESPAEPAVSTDTADAASDVEAVDNQSPAG